MFTITYLLVTVTHVQGCQNFSAEVAVEIDRK